MMHSYYKHINKDMINYTDKKTLYLIHLYLSLTDLYLFLNYHIYLSRKHI